MKETSWSNEGNNGLFLREVLMKRCNILKRILNRVKVGLGLRTRRDLDATRHLVLCRISIRRKVHGQQDISTMGCVIIKQDGRL